MNDDAADHFYEEVFDYFQMVYEYCTQQLRMMSGGQQQLLVVGYALDRGRVVDEIGPAGVDSETAVGDYIGV